MANIPIRTLISNHTFKHNIRCKHYKIGLFLWTQRISIEKSHDFSVQMKHFASISFAWQIIQFCFVDQLLVLQKLSPRTTATKQERHFSYQTAKRNIENTNINNFQKKNKKRNQRYSLSPIELSKKKYGKIHQQMLFCFFLSILCFF